MTKPRIAHIAGSNATITNSPPLVTSNKARERRGLPLMKDADGKPVRFDVLRPQRLAAPVKVYVEQFSAHPLESDAAELYGPPDGFLDASGNFHRERRTADDRPVYEIVLEPKDGLYPLPYMAVQADGKAWDDDGTHPNAPAEKSRQPFYPDGARIFEEIDRLGVDQHGHGSLLSSRADVDFFRVTPPSGYKKKGEVMGKDFFPYRPYHLAVSPSRADLAKITNEVQRILATGRYDGAIWTQGSPRIEETIYWLNLLIDTKVPICGNSSQRLHGMIGNDGDKNLVDAAEFIASRVWADESGRNRVGVVLVSEQRIFSSRDVQKADARPGGYVVTGGHGGIVGAVGYDGPPVLTYLPARKHTWNSEVRLSVLPSSVKNEKGELQGNAIPKVAIVKDANYGADPDDPEDNADLEFLLKRNKGIVVEGHSPYGTIASAERTRVLRRGAYSGVPVVIVGRGNNEGFSGPKGVFIGGQNLTSTKARLLLMACLMRFGATPAAANPDRPTDEETKRLKNSLAEYQRVFDTH